MSAPSPEPQNPTIVIAEDNDFVRMQLARFLTEENYDVVEARDGSEALELAQKQPLALALIDVRMEPMDGFELVKAMHTKNIEVPVIIITGDHNPDLLSESARWNISAVLMKPVQKDRLIQMVSRALQHKKPR